jgi:hypothetical protein
MNESESVSAKTSGRARGRARRRALSAAAHGACDLRLAQLRQAVATGTLVVACNAPKRRAWRRRPKLVIDPRDVAAALMSAEPELFGPSAEALR